MRFEVTFDNGESITVEIPDYELAQALDRAIVRAEAKALEAQARIRGAIASIKVAA